MGSDICSIDETSFEYIEATSQSKMDLLKSIAIVVAILTRTTINLSWVAAN